MGSRGRGSRRGRPPRGRAGRPSRGRARAGMRNRPAGSSRSRIRSTGPSGLAGVPASRESDSGRTPPTRSRFKPCGIATDPASARQRLDSSPRGDGPARRGGLAADRSPAGPMRSIGATRARADQGLGEPEPHRRRPPCRLGRPIGRSRSAPSPAGSNGSGPARSSRQVARTERSDPPSGVPGGRSAAVEESRPSRARRIRKVQTPHSTGVNWSRLSAKARSKPSRRSTTACARAFSIPIASRVASRGAVRWAIMPGRFRPEARQKTSGRSTATAPPQPASSHSRAEGSRPSRVQPPASAPAGAGGAESRGSQSNGSASPADPVGTTALRAASSRLPTRSSRAFRGSTDFAPPRLPNPRPAAPCYPPFQVEPMPGGFQDLRRGDFPPR